MSFFSQFQNSHTLSSHKLSAGSHLSLESICSSGYDSSQSDSRTNTPSDLQPLDVSGPECSGLACANFTPSHAHHHIKQLQVCLSLPHVHQEAGKLQKDNTSSCSDRLSICSSSTVFSCYSCSTCNDRSRMISLSPSFSSNFAANESCDTLLDETKSDFNDSLASQVIHTLKRRSDGWTGPLVKPTDPVLSRLKRGRAEAIRQQEVIEAFLSEASSQLEIQREASKAQSTCVNSEYFEAERLILLAGERHVSYVSEAQQMVSEFGQSVAVDCDPREEDDNNIIDGDLPCLAMLYLSGIKLILCDDFVRKLKSSSTRSLTTHYFLCLVKETRTKGITATHLGSISPSSSSNAAFRIEFNNCFTLPWMPEDFELVIEVYHLAVDGTTLPLKKKFIKVINNLTQRSPAAVVNRCTPRRLLGSCVLPVTDNKCSGERDEPMSSKFERIGHVSVTRESVKQRVFNIEHPSHLVCAVQAYLQVDPDLSVVIDYLPIQGYFSVFGGLQWERRWFVLSSHALSCWLYPDQPELAEPPVSTWSLSECHSVPELASSDECAWDHTFVLPLKTDNADKLLLSAETEAQLNQWMTTLCTLITCFNTWKS